MEKKSSHTLDFLKKNLIKIILNLLFSKYWSDKKILFNYFINFLFMKENKILIKNNIVLVAVISSERGKKIGNKLIKKLKKIVNNNIYVLTDYNNLSEFIPLLIKSFSRLQQVTAFIASKGLGDPDEAAAEQPAAGEPSADEENQARDGLQALRRAHHCRGWAAAAATAAARRKAPSLPARGAGAGLGAQLQGREG